MLFAGTAASRRTPRALSLPSVAVSFREYRDDGLFGRIRSASVAITDLGQLRLGSIVTDGRCDSQLRLDSEPFSVDFSATSWTLAHARESLSSLPVPSRHWLHGFVPNGWMLSFPLSGSRSLWIPCLEFFSRCYGRSQELKRVLSTYPWEVVDQRLFPPLGEPCPPSRWLIRLPSGLVDGDTVFLATARYDRYCEKQARSIYAQIEAKSTPQRPSVALKVRPWFQGSTQLLVSGLWLDTRRFLALRLDGCGNPRGPSIECLYDVSETAHDGADSVEDTGVGVRLVRRLHEPDVPTLTSEAEPDRGAGHIKVRDSDFVDLGPPRKVTKIPRRRRRSASIGLVSNEDPTAYSAGEEHSSGKRVGSAHIHAPEVRELKSEGILLDMWNALSFLRFRFPKLMTSLCWYTFEHGFQPEGPPCLIPLPRIQTPGRRGLLVVRCVACKQTIYIAELQRRRVTDGEEQFMGMVFRLDRAAELDNWLSDVLFALRRTNGGFASVKADCPGKKFLFRHVRGELDQVPCETAVRNALSKLDIRLPVPRR